MSDSNQTLRDAVAAFMDRRGLSPSRLGRLIFGNPSFVGVLMRGGGVRLDTADRMLEFMGLDPIGPRFRLEVEAYLAVTGSKASLVGEEAIGNRSFVSRLRKGSSPHLSTVDRVRTWMARNASEEERRMMEVAVRDGLRSDADADESDATAAPPAVPAGAGGIDPRYMTTRELAEVLHMSRRTLDRYRVSGGGPQFLKLRGRVLYERSDVEEWLAGRRRASTSDSGGLPEKKTADAHRREADAGVGDREWA